MRISDWSSDVCSSDLVREELEALVGEPVEEITASSDDGAGATRVVVGTEAVLQRIGRADAVAILDLDQELLAARYRAAERSDERREGKEWVSPCTERWSRYQ